MTLPRREQWILGVNKLFQLQSPNELVKNSLGNDALLWACCFPWRVDGWARIGWARTSISWILSQVLLNYSMVPSCPLLQRGHPKESLSWLLEAVRSTQLPLGSENTLVSQKRGQGNWKMKLWVIILSLDRFAPTGRWQHQQLYYSCNFIVKASLWISQYSILPFLLYCL